MIGRRFSVVAGPGVKKRVSVCSGRKKKRSLGQMQLPAEEIGLDRGVGHEEVDPVRDPEQPQGRAAAGPRDIVEEGDDLGTIPPGTAERRDGDAHVFPRAVDHVIPIEPTRELAGHRPVPGPARDLARTLSNGRIGSPPGMWTSAPSRWANVQRTCRGPFAALASRSKAAKSHDFPRAR